MGLDMYAYAIEKHVDNTDLSMHRNSNDELDGGEIHYWRKHHNLHGWMEMLYRKKGGTDDFNCTPVRLTVEDLDDLEHVINTRKLPETVGFFFGNNPPDDESDADDIQFIKDARAAIADGKDVYYNSWW